MQSFIVKKCKYLSCKILDYFVAFIATWKSIRKECTNISFWIEKTFCNSKAKSCLQTSAKQVNLFLHEMKFCLEDLLPSSKAFNEAQCYLNCPLIYCQLLKPVHWCSSNWSVLKKLPLGLRRSHSVHSNLRIIFGFTTSWFDLRLILQ